jgi:hypothetical protein
VAKSLEVRRAEGYHGTPKKRLLSPVFFLHAQQFLNNPLSHDFLRDFNLFYCLPCRSTQVICDDGNDHENVAETERDPDDRAGLVHDDPVAQAGVDDVVLA